MKVSAYAIVSMHARSICVRMLVPLYICVSVSVCVCVRMLVPSYARAWLHADVRTHLPKSRASW
jgi:Na+-translocating ferredoxin:NAD+ oxidoreductase RnfE subunit